MVGRVGVANEEKWKKSSQQVKITTINYGEMSLTRGCVHLVVRARPNGDEGQVLTTGRSEG